MNDDEKQVLHLPWIPRKPRLLVTRGAIAAVAGLLATFGCAHRAGHRSAHPQTGYPGPPVYTQAPTTAATASNRDDVPPEAHWNADRTHAPNARRTVASPEPPDRDTPCDRRQQALRAQFEQAPSLRTLRGKATYYSDALAGRRTASGQVYRPEAFTAAHRTLPFGTILRVRIRGRGPVVYVTVTDRGPFGRSSVILDLSRAAAERAGLLRAGVAPIVAEVMVWGKKRHRRRRRHR